MDITEAKRLLLAAKEKGVILRLAGGLAFQVHCKKMAFCERSHVDIDLAGLSKQSAQIAGIIKGLGYVENTGMTMATGGKRMLFGKLGSKDHVDVFLDNLDFEHVIKLQERLEIEESTLSVSDLLLSKLSISRLNDKDIRDIITFLNDLPLGDQDLPDTINIDYIARLCSRSWGLYHDVLESVAKCFDILGSYGLNLVDNEHVLQTLSALRNAMVESKKTTRWKIRSLVGERIPWRRTVDNQIG